MKLRKGDNAIMLSGKDRGKSGKVVMIFLETRTLILEGLNLVKRHTRSRQRGKAGQIISKERAVSGSSVALVCKNCGKPTRIGYKIEGDKKIRICKKCKSEV